jgi:hypothetical protein
MSKQTPTPNDHRSVVKNPTSPAYQQNHGNRGSQMNPQHPNYQGGEGSKQSPQTQGK